MKNKLLLPLLALTALLAGCGFVRTPATYAEAIRLRDTIALECGVSPTDLKTKTGGYGRAGNVMTSEVLFTVPKTSCGIKNLKVLVASARAKWGKLKSFGTTGTDSGSSSHFAISGTHFGDHESQAFVEIFAIEGEKDTTLDLRVKVLER